MPNYDILYLDAQGKVASKVVAECASDREAKILAHALKASSHKGLKIRTGLEHKLVYQRPMAPCLPG